MADSLILGDYHQHQHIDSGDGGQFEQHRGHGQRVVGGPPEGWQGAAPGRGCEVYVTRIPRDCFEAELLPVFSRVGPIYEHRLMMEQNGLNRGYAYVKFTNIQVC